MVQFTGVFVNKYTNKFKNHFEYKKLMYYIHYPIVVLLNVDVTELNVENIY